ncbi:ATP-NAD kinase-like domain [Pseudocohnilembus persalinus]|uniref:Diacylglycerol kinase n=1 Tax=Pseudocohnilembus persalinus TaxID=266149 RepID=A0A0V0R504_PSEPJ|nr:ATP-NAD kinase-like domain [Pseudocohnilembus persalinus]|eukprot:KRX09440.1 ATP-NAD kinase-like domain [Pseudocohnilembus persalinus]
MGGLFCNSMSECTKCGILIHNLCRIKRKTQSINKKSENFHKCKFVTTNENEDIHPHQFIEGNLPFNSICSVCDMICSSMYELKGEKCIWCQRCVHNECKKKLSENCDMGSLKNIVIRPNQVKYHKVETSPVKSRPYKNVGNSEDTETELDITRKQGWTFKQQPNQKPIVVIINKKSGGQLGEAFMAQFYRHLNPIQVIDLLKEGLDRLLIFKDIHNLKILVCGGDGTVASVANFMKDLSIPKWSEKNPPIAILPIGTGNDLGRALGWGGGGQTEDMVPYILQQVENGQNVLHDRWQIKFENDQKKPETTMYNYFSLGLDARVCYGFHDLREKHPYLFKSRIGNKFIYTHIGTVDLLQQKTAGFAQNKPSLDKYTELVVDGKKIELPEVENLAFVNISSWAGGAQNLWYNEQQIKTLNNKNIYKPQSFSDGVIEVLGVTSIFHLGQVQVNLQSPIRICQGKKIEITLKDNQHMQIDGEPFLIKPQKIVLQRKDQVYMMTNLAEQQKQPETVHLKYESQIVNTLDWAEAKQHISHEQKQILLKKFLAQ